jgi:preprotein translocase subunit SecG
MGLWLVVMIVVGLSVTVLLQYAAYTGSSCRGNSRRRSATIPGLET